VHPVEGARHVGAELAALEHELEYVFGAGGHVVDEEDDGVGGGGRRRGDEGREGQVPQVRELADAGALARVDVGGGEGVGDAEVGEEGRQRREHVVGAVGGVAADDGERAAARPEEPHRLDDAAEEAGQEPEALAQVQREEVLDARGPPPELEPCGPERGVALGVEGRAFEAGQVLRRGVEDCVDVRRYALVGEDLAWKQGLEPTRLARRS
jgi:hypothetical protein